MGGNESKAVLMATDNRADMMSRLPQEVRQLRTGEHSEQMCEEIMSYLDVRTLNALAGVSNNWRQISESKAFWAKVRVKMGIAG
jgi:hypothetical protein